MPALPWLLVVVMTTNSVRCVVADVCDDDCVAAGYPPGSAYTYFKPPFCATHTCAESCTADVCFDDYHPNYCWSGLSICCCSKPVDCSSGWTAWSPCEGSCTGVTKRTFVVLVEGRDGGMECDHADGYWESATCHNDIDSDGVCGDVDSCPSDYFNDLDSDFLCGNVDSCEQDASNDADGDMICDDVDSCIGDAPNSDCFCIAAIEGQWTIISSSSGPQTVSFEVGTTRSETVEDSDSWGSTVTETASAEFEVSASAGVASAKATAGLTVSGAQSSTLARSYSSVFSATSTTTYTYEFGAGVVWQWTFDITTGCGIASATGPDLALTPNALTGPCCLPGMFVDVTDPTGPCLVETTDLCVREESTSTNSRTTATATGIKRDDPCLCAGTTCQEVSGKMTEGMSLQDLDKLYDCNCQTCDEQVDRGSTEGPACTWWTCE